MDGRKFKARTEKEAVAEEIANALNDQAGLDYYLAMARRYPADYLLKVLRHVLKVPPDKIRTTRGALFNWLVSHYAESEKEDI